MAITPVELRNMRFERKFRGYDPFYVDTIIAEAAAEMEKLIDVNTDLQRQMKNLEDRNRTYENIEQTLKDTLVTAQQAADATQKAAQRESEARLQETDVVCKQLKAEYMAEVEQVKMEIATLRMQKARFLAELKSLIEGHYRMIEERQKIEQETASEAEYAATHHE
jgi:cell division initiation protein